MRARNVVETWFVALALGVAPGCMVVDAGPLERLRTAADAGMPDAPLVLEDVPTDVPPPEAPADECGDPEAFLLIGSGTYDIDTTGLNPDFSILGMATGGNDAFYQFDGVSGQFWHFHLAALSPGRNPVLYVVQSSGGVCSSSPVAVRNACTMSEGDEHFAFVPPTTGRYYLGIDDGNAGGGRYRLQVIRPVCGNGVQEHGEPCDEDPMMGRCDSMCRILLADLDATGTTSVPPGRHNDTATEAMIVQVAAGDTIDVRGTVPAGDCYPDVFAVDLPAGARIRVTARNATSTACVAEMGVSYGLELQNAAGSVIATGGNDGMGCFGIDQMLTNPGRYFVWLSATGDPSRPANYTLRFEHTP